MAHVSLVRQDGVAVVRFANPARRNALTTALAAELGAALRAVDDARAVVLRTETPDPVWCAGFDIAELRPGWDVLGPDGPLAPLFAAIRDHPAPVLAMLDGTAWGGGADLALRCDILLGSPECGFAFTPARIGLPYDADGLRNLLWRAPLSAAIEMFATGDLVPAERARALGLLDHLLPAEALESATMAMAARIAANAPLAVRAAKRQLRALADALPAPQMRALRQAVLDSADYAEGLAAFAARRTPHFRGC